MQISTTRFGNIGMDKQDVIFFPKGLIGLEDIRHWVLLADAENEALGWLQSTADPEVALAVISPRRFIPHYRVRVGKRELAAVDLESLTQAYVLTIVSENRGRLTANLRAPLVFNLERRLGRQIVTSDDQPLQWELTVPRLKIRKSA
jgi:flagellar assembly factor FliW